MINGRSIAVSLIAGMLGVIATVQAASVTLAWDPANPTTEVSGYKPFYGLADTTGAKWYTKVCAVGRVTLYTLEGLTAGHLYVFAVQSYGDDGKVSDFSPKLQHRIPPATTAAHSLKVVAVDSEELADLGAVRTACKLSYLPRQDGKLNGTVVGYEVYL